MHPCGTSRQVSNKLFYWSKLQAVNGTFAIDPNLGACPITMPYNKDLAYIHDVGFTDSARQAAATVLKLLQQRRVRLSGSPCSNPGWRLRAGRTPSVPSP